MTLLLDQGVPADAASLFRSLGYDCTHVSEIGMSKAEDEEIILLAEKSEAVIVTLDADFQALIAVRGWRKPSIVRLRREGCRAEDVVRILAPILADYRLLLLQGGFLSVKESKTTVHRLPIG